ncbi:hypothetical protein OE88DRAFT_1609512, partial [Heliocybe sulcata]
TAIGAYYMNHPWMDKQKIRVNHTQYQGIGHNKETPSKYFICKCSLLELVYNYTDLQLISEVMDGIPPIWNNILTTQLYDNLVDF